MDPCGVFQRERKWRRLKSRRCADSLSPSLALSREEGLIFLFLHSRSGVTQATEETLLFLCVLRLFFIPFSCGPRLHHQPHLSFLRLRRDAAGGLSELVHQVDRVGGLRRGQVHLDGRNGVCIRQRLDTPGLRVYTRKKTRKCIRQKLLDPF